MSPAEEHLKRLPVFVGNRQVFCHRCGQISVAAGNSSGEFAKLHFSQNSVSNENFYVNPYEKFPNAHFLD